MNSFFGVIWRGDPRDKSRKIIEDGMASFRARFEEPTHVFISNNLSLVEIDGIRVEFDRRLKANEVWAGVYKDTKDYANVSGESV